jgi:tetratricopeptide (TPR) repeat protein
MRKPWWRRANVIVGIIFWMAVVAALGWHFSAPALSDTRVVSAYFGVGSVRLEKGSLRVASRRPRHVYRIATTDPQIRDVLQAADDAGKSVAWRLHLDGASIDTEGARAQFWVESFELDGTRYGPWRERARWSWRRLPEAQATLLRGLGLEFAGQHREALAQLDAAIAADGQTPAIRALALELRADTLASLAYANEDEVNDEDDALLMRAIEDYRRAAKLDPGQFDLVTGEGNAAAVLGAYEEALKLFESVEKRWPDQFFYVAMRRSAIYRQSGDPAAALGVLDELVRNHGRARGMMYHFHRAWALNDLGRHEDAIRELTSGLEAQPDYPWAYAHRACAKAQLGRVADALADQKRAMELFEQMSRAKPDADEDSARKKLQVGLRGLEAALQQAPTRATAVACRTSDTNPQVARRERSRLFDGAG